MKLKFKVGDILFWRTDSSMRARITKIEHARGKHYYHYTFTHSGSFATPTDFYCDYEDVEIACFTITNYSGIWKKLNEIV